MKLLDLPERTAASRPAALADGHPAYRPDIDGLRAVAVLAVVFYHAFPRWMPGGFAGVDIFFVISGFLIGSIIMGGLERGTFGFGDFYARRIRRIFPALLVVMAACAAFGWFALFADEYAQLGKHIAGGAGFISNILLWNEVGYFDTAAATKPLLHLWSLGIEEQFYIAWPLILAAAWRLRISLFKTALGLAALSFLVNVGGLHHYPSATFYSPASRVWELLLGAALAWMGLHHAHPYFGWRVGGDERHVDLAAPRARDRLGFLGLALLVLALAVLRADKHFPGFWALLPVLGSVCLIAAGPASWVNRKVLARRPLVLVGLISYPLYLWHWPLLSFAAIVESGTPARPIRIAAVLAALVLATLTYWLVERPLRSTRRGGAKVAGLALAMTALAGFGGWLWRHDGLPQRPSVVASSKQQKELVLVEDTANAAACKARYGMKTLYEYCLLDNVNAAPTVALIGDSHAFHVVAGLTRYYRAHGDNLWYLGTRVPFYGVPASADDPYQQATPKMLDLALHTPSVKTVIFSTAVKLQEENDEGRQVVRAFRDTLQKFVASGREVIVYYDNPLLDFEPRSCIRRAGVASSQTRLHCALPRKTWEDITVHHRPAFEKVLKDFPQVKVFNTNDYVCNASECPILVGDMLLYRDTHHFSHDGDLWMGEHFAAWHAARNRVPSH
ncbi:MAG: acyltransferase family protein [Telluria sp.]